MVKDSVGTRRPGRLTVVALAALAMIVGPVLGEATGNAATSTVGTWELTDPLNVVRYSHTSTLLTTGKVLAAGGKSSTSNTTGTSYTSAELYDPITEEWTPTGSMSEPRWSHTATLLRDGRVLVAGGFDLGNPLPVRATAELYDPATGTWTPTGSMNVSRALHIAALLPDGRVLVAGGRTCNLPPPSGCATQRTNTAEIYDPATGQWTFTGEMSADRHTTAAVTLQDGRVIVPAGFTATQGNGSNTADIYDPTTGTWSLTGFINVGRARQGAMLLPDGRVLIAMGFRGPGVPNPTTETYDPATNTWTFAGNIDFPFSRFNFHYGVMPNGMAVVAGGQFFQNQQNSGIVRDSHIFNPATNTWTNTAPLNDPHGTPGGQSNSQPMVILSASPWSYVADPAVCGRHCGKAMIAGDSPTGSTELFTAPNTCFGFNATIIGTEGPDTIFGTRGRDVILGLGGDDRISASYSDDIVCGGEGNDQISGDYNNDIILGEAGADRLSGADGNDFLFGEGESDQLVGMAGFDTADGGQAAREGESDACVAEVMRNCP